MTLLSSRVSALAPSIIREMSNRRRETSINLSLGEPKLTPASEILDRAWEKLRSGPQGYTHNAGLAELRSKIAQHYNFTNKGSAENVIVTVGSEEAVCLAMMSTLDAGDEVLIPEPGYPAYRGLASLIGAVSVPYPIERATGLVPRAQAIRDRLTERSKVIILNGPSNPFGCVDDKTELEAIAQLAEEFDLVVISDEIYREIYYSEDPPPSIMGCSDRAIFVSGLSKCCAMTGLRLGYLVAEAEFVKKATLAHQLLVTCAPRLSQLAAIEVFDSPYLLREQVEFYAKTRELIKDEASTLPDDVQLYLGDGAFYAVLDISSRSSNPLEYAIALFEAQDVVVVPGTAFGASGDWFWRLSYAGGTDPVREGLRRIASFMTS